MLIFFQVHLIMYMNKLEAWTSDTAPEISYLRSDFFHRVLQCTILYSFRHFKLFALSCIGQWFNSFVYPL